MECEWDEDKRLANLEKHGIDFSIASTIWERLPLDPYAQNWGGGEHRRIAIGIVPDERGEKIITVVLYPSARPRAHHQRSVSEAL